MPRFDVGCPVAFVTTAQPPFSAEGILDKRGLLTTIDARSHVVIELGCGPRKRHHDAIGIDALDYECVDVVGDVYAVLRRLRDESVDAVYSYHFVEHVPDLPGLLVELRRVLKPAGTITTVAPHFSNPYFYSDFTHRTAFGLYSFSYFARDRLLRRQVPQYFGDTGLDLVSVRLHFKASPPFYLRHAFRRVVQSIVNLSTFTKEYYESSLCYLVPCYEVEYVVSKRLITASTRQ